MSAYGSISRPANAEVPTALVPRSYALPATTNASSSSDAKFLTVVPVARAAELPDDALLHLAEIFDSVVKEGRTYPQETELGLDGFKAYFLSHDLFVGILDTGFSGDASPVKAAAPTTVLPPVPQQPDPASTTLALLDLKEDEGVTRDASVTIDSLRAGRPWQDCLAGMFYVKPNYPGRSSHCCNAGFVVDPTHRGKKLGLTLGKAFLHFGPRLGYRASVFNLVYINNVASLAIWDRLGFTRAGLIPRAGRLKTADGRGEEYVDAVVYWRDLCKA